MDWLDVAVCAGVAIVIVLVRWWLHGDFSLVDRISLEENRAAHRAMLEIHDARERHYKALTREMDAVLGPVRALDRRDGGGAVRVRSNVRNHPFVVGTPNTKAIRDSNHFAYVAAMSFPPPPIKAPAPRAPNHKHQWEEVTLGEEGPVVNRICVTSGCEAEDKDTKESYAQQGVVQIGDLHAVVPEETLDRLSNGIVASGDLNEGVLRTEARGRTYASAVMTCRRCGDLLSECRKWGCS